MFILLTEVYQIQYACSISTYYFQILFILKKCMIASKKTLNFIQNILHQAYILLLLNQNKKHLVFNAV